jgi:3-deoxy-7-phosphoheptulonate synthase
MKLCEILNIDNKPRKLIVIICMGAKKLSEEFLTLVLAMWIIGHIVTWFSDPVHGSTINVALDLKPKDLMPYM